MKRNRLLCAAALVALSATLYQVRANPYITIRLSYKIVLSPVDGTRPLNDWSHPELGTVTDQQIDDVVTSMNAMLATYGRGYRYQRVAILDVGGIGDTTGPSKWFIQPPEGFKPDWQQTMDAEAHANKALYKWDDNAINIYSINAIHGGSAPFPGSYDLVAIGGATVSYDLLTIHELGHFFNLCHTQGCGCNDCDGLDDGVSDTILDGSTWDSEDSIAQHDFGLLYSQLTATQMNQVDDVWLNIMSYHNVGNRLTEGQLDRWTDGANGGRFNTVSGRTWFVDSHSGAGDGSSTAPFASLISGVTSADAARGDIVLIRAGAYNNRNYTINKNVTLRASRYGGVVIGSSNLIPLQTGSVLPATGASAPGRAPTTTRPGSLPCDIAPAAK
ncbi:MAG TPA: M43 family zinc metalloprotease [Armatimonadota bacterium]|jgi:hypothetical protein